MFPLDLAHVRSVSEAVSPLAFVFRNSYAASACQNTLAKLVPLPLLWMACSGFREQPAFRFAARCRFHLFEWIWSSRSQNNGMSDAGRQKGFQQSVCLPVSVWESVCFSFFTVSIYSSLFKKKRKKNKVAWKVIKQVLDKHESSDNKSFINR